MKVLFFIHSLGLGGAERVTATLANYWVDGGWQVVILTLADKAHDRYRLDQSVTRVALDRAVASGSLIGAITENWRRVRAVRRVLLDQKPDVTVAMMNTANVVLALASAGIGRAVCVGSERVHPPDWPLRKSWGVLRALTYGWLDTIVVLTSESQAWVRSHTSARRVDVIPNPVAWPMPPHDPVRVPGSVGTPGRRRMLTVGRLEPQKGFRLLVEVFATLAPRFPDWELVIVGEGPMRTELEGVIAASHLDHLVLLPGQVGNLGDWYSQADLYVLTSQFEGFPNALAEAMAHGLPAVSFDCDTGPRDIIRHEVDGLLVAPGDDGALVAALARLMGDVSLRAQFAAAAVEVRARFSLERVSDMWSRLFRELAA